VKKGREGGTEDRETESVQIPTIPCRYHAYHVNVKNNNRTKQTELVMSEEYNSLSAISQSLTVQGA